MKTMLRRSMVAWVVGGVAALACTDPGPTPDDAGLDAGAPTDAATPDTGAFDATIPDATTPDATVSDATVPDSATPDAATPDATTLDATTPDGAVDAGSDASATDAGDAGDASIDAGALPPPVFAPGESGAAYTMVATCAITAVNRVGTAGSCCRASTYTLTTTCDTSLREEPDGAGSLRVVVDPMAACTTELSGENCTRSGELARCDASNLLCPYHSFTGGAPSLVAGTYARRMKGTLPMPGGLPYTPVDSYWIEGCPSGPTGRGDLPANVCEPPGLTPIDQNHRILTTLARTGPGAFSIRRSWPYPGSEASCDGPTLSTPLVLAKESFASGSAAGGTFYLDKYMCAYSLTKK